MYVGIIRKLALLFMPKAVSEHATMKKESFVSSLTSYCDYNSYKYFMKYFFQAFCRVFKWSERSLKPQNIYDIMFILSICEIPLLLWLY